MGARRRLLDAMKLNGRRDRFGLGCVLAELSQVVSVGRKRIGLGIEDFAVFIGGNSDTASVDDTNGRGIPIGRIRDLVGPAIGFDRNISQAAITLEGAFCEQEFGGRCRHLERSLVDAPSSIKWALGVYGQRNEQQQEERSFHVASLTLSQSYTLGMHPISLASARLPCRAIITP